MRGVPAGRALCLLLLCGWALAARGQEGSGERGGGRAGTSAAGFGLGAGVFHRARLQRFRA